jgi:hypothetical protein
LASLQPFRSLQNIRKNPIGLLTFAIIANNSHSH